jgi:hypothetical protein
MNNDFPAPRSLMGLLFGEDYNGKSGPKPTIRCSLNQAQIDALCDNKAVRFSTDDADIQLVAPARYTRKYVDGLLKAGRIDYAQQQAMLRERA